MTTDFIIRSWENDFEFLKYCLRSIQRFATGFRRTVVITPFGQKPPTGDAEDVWHVSETQNEYLGQQITKLHADAFTDAEFFVYMDSDSILTRPVCPEDLIVDKRRVRWLYTPYSSLGNDDSQLWKPITEKVLGCKVHNETMRRHPLVVPRWALEEFRKFIWRAHGVSLDRYVIDQPNRDFSEWNALGNYLWIHHHDRIEWQNTDEDMGTVFTHQSYSWGGLNPDLRAHLEAALA